MNLYPIEYSQGLHYYPFVVNTDRCVIFLMTYLNRLLLYSEYYYTIKLLYNTLILLNYNYIVSYYNYITITITTNTIML